MRNLSLILLAAISASALAFPASAQVPPKKKGQTIFGENRKATMKAMRMRSTSRVTTVITQESSGNGITAGKNLIIKIIMMTKQRQ